MRQISITLYRFSELNDKAKERARDWLRGLTFSDSSDWDCVYNDAQRVAAILGIEFNQRQYKTVGGNTGTEPAIYFSGFSNQGDGACFEGRYAYAKGAAKAIRKECPTDTKLHGIADRLQALQARHFYKLTATTKHSGHYSHSGCMDVEVTKGDDYADHATEKELTELLREFADWIYSELESEHDHLNSDENIESQLENGGYEFNESGEVA